MPNRFLLAACLIAPLAVLSGCGDNGLGMVKVRGTVTFDGGPCPDAGKIGFGAIEPATPELPRRGGKADFDEAGKFVVTSFKDGDGLVPGRYQVRISCFSEPIAEGMTKAQVEAISHVPADFDAGELIVEPGSSAITFDIDVPKKK